MDNSENIYRLADTTYRDVDELIGNLRSLAGIARNLCKAMEDVIPMAEEFTNVLDSIGSKASNLPGGVRKLGDSLKEMAKGHRSINSAYTNWIASINTDLVIPLEDKLSRGQSDQIRDWKLYKNECSKKENIVEKSNSKLKALRKKKITSENQEKEAQICQILADQQSDLHSTRVEGLRKALIDQQKMYSFLVYHLCGVTQSQIAYNALAHNTLSTKVTEWSSLTNNYEELPQESIALLKNPHAPEAFNRGSDHKNEVDLNTQTKQEQNEITAADIRRMQLETAPDIAQGRKRRISCRVKAMFPHNAKEGGQLAFKPGDLIDAISEERDGWQFGTNASTKETGWFPAQYVDQVWPTPEPVRRIKSSSSSQGHNTMTQQAPTNIKLPERDYIVSGRSPVITRRNIPQPPPLDSPTSPPPGISSEQLSFSEQIKLRATQTRK